MQYNHLLVSQMPKQLTEEETNLLYQSALDGDMTAKDKLIAGNMAVVISRVNAFIHKCPRVSYLRDDLTGAGFVALTKAVNKSLSSGQVKKLLSHINVTIDDDLTHLIEKEMTIRIPLESARLARKKGTPIKQCRVQSLTDDIFSDMETDFELKDLIDSCCETDSEREFVRLRSLGNTLAEISVELSMPLTSLFRMSCKLLEKVDQKLQD